MKTIKEILKSNGIILTGKGKNIDVKPTKELDEKTKAMFRDPKATIVI